MNPLYKLLAELGIAAAVVVGAFAAGHHGGFKAGSAQVQARWDDETKVRSETAIKKLESNRIADRENEDTQQENLNEARRLLNRVVDAGPAAAAVGNGLRVRFASVASTCDRGAGSEASSPGSQAASSPGDLLAYVQRRLDEAADRTAEFADAAAIAGQVCWADGNANYAASLKGRK